MIADYVVLESSDAEATACCLWDGGQRILR